MDINGLIRTVLERTYYASFFVAIGGGALYAAKGLGMEFPEGVLPWVNFGLIAALALIVTESGRRFFSWLGRRLSNVIYGAKNDAEVLRNVSALYAHEAILLGTLLDESHPQRFTVERNLPLEALLHKGVLTAVAGAGPFAMLCEVHPAVVRDRAAILETIARIPQSPPMPRPPPRRIY